MATIGTRLHTLLKGKHVGTDPFGNRYYVERSPEKGARTRRWVVYRGLAEPSKVPPMWHGWLHYTLPDPPKENAVKHYDWEKGHVPNLTGTAGAYLPPGHLKRGGYRDSSTSDYEAWIPKL